MAFHPTPTPLMTVPNQRALGAYTCSKRVVNSRPMLCEVVLSNSLRTLYKMVLRTVETFKRLSFICGWYLFGSMQKPQDSNKLSLLDLSTCLLNRRIPRAPISLAVSKYDAGTIILSKLDRRNAKTRVHRDISVRLYGGLDLCFVIYKLQALLPIRGSNIAIPIQRYTKAEILSGL